MISDTHADIDRQKLDSTYSTPLNPLKNSTTLFPECPSKREAHKGVRKTARQIRRRARPQSN